MSKQKQWDGFKNKMSCKRLGERKKRQRWVFDSTAIIKVGRRKGTEIHQNWPIDNGTVPTWRKDNWKYQTSVQAPFSDWWRISMWHSCKGKEGHLTQLWTRLKTANWFTAGLWKAWLSWKSKRSKGNICTPVHPLRLLKQQGIHMVCLHEYQ